MVNSREKGTVNFGPSFWESSDPKQEATLNKMAQDLEKDHLEGLRKKEEDELKRGEAHLAAHSAWAIYNRMEEAFAGGLSRKKDFEAMISALEHAMELGRKDIQSHRENGEDDMADDEESSNDKYEEKLRLMQEELAASEESNE